MQKQKNCIIIHGCPGSDEARDPDKRTYDKHWLPWLKAELEQVGVKSHIPSMPEPWSPIYNEYRKEFEKYEINEDSILIGHSCGCAFLVRWLGETRRKIDRLVLVAPWKIPETGNITDELFYSFEIDESIRDRVNKITIFTSDNEEKDGKESVKIFYEALGGKVIELAGCGHFVTWHMGTVEFPELLSEIID